MGAWGSSLYANDTTLDVRDTYLEYLKRESSDEQVLQLTLQDFEEYLNTDEEPFVWLALADTLWKYGRLTEEVKTKALYWIENEGGMELWEDSANKGAGWKKTLVKLKEKLNSTMPDKNTIKKPVQFDTNPWNIGDVYAFHFTSNCSMKTEFYDKYILVQKIGESHIGKNVIVSHIQIFNKLFCTLPYMQEIEALTPLPLYPRNEGSDIFKKVDDLRLNAQMVIKGPRSFPKKNLVFMGNAPNPNNYPIQEFSYMFWEEFECDNIPYFYNEWKEFEYKIDEDLLVTITKKTKQESIDIDCKC